MAVYYPASKARVNFGAIIERVSRKGEEVVIERLGKPIVKISPYHRLSHDIEWLRTKLARYVKNFDSTQAVREDRDRDR